MNSLIKALIWGLSYVEDKVYTLLLPANIDDMKDQIAAAINTVYRDILRCVWNEFSYGLDVVRAADGGYTEHW